MKITNISLLSVQLLIMGMASLSFALTASAKSACVRSQEGKVLCGELIDNPNPSRKQTTNTDKIIESAAGVDFTLEGCKKLKTGVSCSISMYNSTEFDKKMSWGFFLGQNSLIDSNGNEYLTQAIKLGNSRNSSATIPPKTAVKANIFFRPNGELGNYIKILKISPIIEGNRKVELVFRDFKLI
jgi:hypothetical protein